MFYCSSVNTDPCNMTTQVIILFILNDAYTILIQSPYSVIPITRVLLVPNKNAFNKV